MVSVTQLKSFDIRPHTKEPVIFPLACVRSTFHNIISIYKHLVAISSISEGTFIQKQLTLSNLYTYAMAL